MIKRKMLDVLYSRRHEINAESAKLSIQLRAPRQSETNDHLSHRDALAAADNQLAFIDELIDLVIEA